MRKRLLTTLFLAFIFTISVKAQTGLVINEMMSNNSSFKADEDGDNEDWIEIYNGSGADVNLQNYGLSDNSTNLGKWKFPNIIIPNGGYLIVWASSKNRKPGTDAPTVGIVNKRYENIKGTTIASLTGFANYPNNPDSKYIVTELKTSVGLMDEYGEQYYGWFTAPATGNYIFSISGKNEANFSLSTDASEANLVQRCSVSTAGTAIGTFNSSGAIALMAGQKYFFKALHKENESFYSVTMEDHLTVRVQYPNGTIESPISATNCTVPYSELHTNFSIATLGETLTLSDPAGLILSTLDAVNLSKTNIAFGRSPNGSGTFGFFETPTPGIANTSTSFQGILPKPSFSQTGGFFNSNQMVSISHSDASASIIYTLDGSNPMPSTIGGVNYNYKNSYPNQTGTAVFGPMLTKQIRSYNYTAPLSLSNRSKNPPATNDISTISSTTEVTASYLPTAENVSMGNVVRAIATKTNWISSDVATENYFIFPNGASKFTLPVMSINTHTPDFVGYENGIHVPGKDYDNLRMTNGNGTGTWQLNSGNFTREGSISERRANMTFIKNGVSVLNQDIGIRIQGDATRFLPVKTIRMYPRSEYSGSSTFNYPFYPNDNTSTFRRMFMRNSSQDYNNTLLRDGLIQTSVNHLNFSTQKYTPIITFINGEYYGLTDLRERIDTKYIEAKYGVAETEVDIINLNGRRGPEAKDGDLEHYNALMNYTNINNLATQSNFDYVTTQIDTESIIDYYITGVYYNSVDWPYNNNTFWRKKTNYTPTAPYGQDGRYRWTLYGAEIAAGFPTSFPVSPSASLNMIDGLFNTGTQTGDIALQYSASGTRFIRKMIENTGFKNQFITRFADLLNTAFLPSRLNAKLDSMKTVLQPEIPEYATRWNVMGNTTAATTWNNNVAVITNYINAHHPLQRDHIRAKWGISSNQNVVLNVSNPSHGYIKINTIDIKNGTPGVATQPYPWTGVYFNGIPITLTANALPGYTFVNWSGASTSTNPTITLTPTANLTLTANFISSATPNPIYFWAFTSALPNGTLLTNINSTYSLIGSPAQLNFTSALGSNYPLLSTYPTSYPKSSLERRNLPTNINYIQSANNNIVYASAGILGIQVKPAFNIGGNENTMLFNMPTTGYKDIKFAFASSHELAANQLIIDYALDKNNPTWINFATSPNTATYQLFNYDFSNILGVENNPNFVVRVRFGDLQTTAPVRVNFNNVSLIGTPLLTNLTVNAAITPTTCTNPNGGAINLTITNGQIPYTYLWSNGATTKDLSSLPAGIYSVTVTDNAGNTALKTTTIPTASIQAGIESNRASVNCLNPSATLKASGGVSYIWSTGETASTITVSPFVNTTYTVTALGANGCTSTAYYTLGVDKIAPIALISAPVSQLTCTAASTVLTASGGGTYIWSDGNTSNALTVTSAGTYTVTVTGTNGCSAIANQTITENKILPTASIVADFTSLNCTNPTATLTATGGGTYAWSSGETTNSIDVSPTENTTYTLTVTGSNGCTSTKSQLISVDKTIPTASIAANFTSLNCTNPTATLTATGGGTYAWSSGETTNSIVVSPTENTTYTLTVTGSNGCTSTKSTLISVDKTLPTASIASNFTSLNCTNPTATLTATGGGTYAWSSGETTNSIVVSPTENTTYTLTVTGLNGCTSTKSQLISVDKTIPTASIAANFTSLNCTNPTATLTATGGGTYAWSSGETTNSIVVSPTENTTYTLTVTGSNGCTSTKSTLISVDKTLPTASIAANFTSLNCTNPTATLTATGGGTYAWSSGETTASISVSPTENTIYSVTVTGSNGCTSTKSQLISVDKTIPTASIAADFTSLNCSNPTATLTATGGGTYAWSSGETTPSISVSPTENTTYTLTVTGLNGCTSTKSQLISVDKNLPNNELTSSNGLELNCNFANTTLSASATGTYIWSNLATTQAIIVSGAGTYSVIITGANGCTNIGNISIIKIEQIQITPTVTNASCNMSNGSINLSIAGGAVPLTFNWSNGATTKDIMGLSAGTYTVSVSDKNGCTATLPIQVMQPISGSISSSVWVDTNGNGLQEITETSLDGVPVKLFLAYSDGTPNGLEVKSTVTASGGKYKFENVCAGNYVLQFENFGNYVRTYKPNNSGKDLLDSDANPSTGFTNLIEISEGENDLTNQAGYYLPSKIGGIVFKDINGNNIKNAEDSGLVDVDIALTGTNGGGQNVALNTASGANGIYSFDNLAPGSYLVTINNNLVPQNILNKNSNSKIQLAIVYVPSSNNTFNVNLESGTDTQINNVGYFVPAKISSFVWDDQNKNGIRDNGEPGLTNISINISGVEGDGMVVPITSIASDMNGLFSFGNLSPGNYTINFTSPIGYVFTDSNIGSDENIDSDAVNGAVNNVQIISGEIISNVSAGFKIAVALAVDLLEFFGKTANNQAFLNWKATNETNFSNYEIQRSINKLEFASIGNVNAASKTHYNFIDENPENSVNYYRLKMINNDGTFKFSKIIALDFSKETIFVIAENPAVNGAFNLYTNTSIQNLVLSNILGIEIPINRFEMSKNNYKIIVQNPVSGIYFLKLNDGKNQVIRKVLVR